MFKRRKRWRHGWNSGAKACTVGRTVADLAPGEVASVFRLASEAAGELNKLMAFGVLPGAPLVLLQRSPSYVLKVGETVLALDEKIARAILVGPSAQGDRL